MKNFIMHRKQKLQSTAFFFGSIHAILANLRSLRPRIVPCNTELCKWTRSRRVVQEKPINQLVKPFPWENRFVQEILKWKFLELKLK